MPASSTTVTGPFRVAACLFLGDVLGVASARRHGRPELVIPLQVVEGFFESFRPSNASGAFAKCDMASDILVGWGGKCG